MRNFEHVAGQLMDGSKDVIVEWLHWGVEPQSSSTLKRKVLQTNVAAFIAVVTMFIVDASVLMFGKTSMIAVVIAELPILFMQLAVPWLNQKGKRNLARWDLAISLITSELIALYVGFDYFHGVHYYFILFAVASVAIFPKRQWRSVLFLFVLSLALFLNFEFNWLVPIHQSIDFDVNFSKFMDTAFAATALLTILMIIWMIEHIAERNEIRLERISVTDVLTNLPNRRFFEMIFRQEVAKCRRSGAPLTLAMLDIDHFKKVNDTYGHSVGDEVLKFIANNLRKATRGGNIVARVGGEEFAVLLPETTVIDAVEIAERIRKAIETGKYQHGEQVLKVTVSAGVTAVDCTLPEEVSYALADEALYSAKNSGRNRVV
jgi:diguanylate cyclase (GGDEF)-like protein